MSESKTLCVRFSEAVIECANASGLWEQEVAGAWLMQVGEELLSSRNKKLLDSNDNVDQIIASCLEGVERRCHGQPQDADRLTIRILCGLRAATPAFV